MYLGGRPPGSMRPPNPTTASLTSLIGNITLARNESWRRWRWFVNTSPAASSTAGAGAPLREERWRWSPSHSSGAQPRRNRSTVSRS